MHKRTSPSPLSLTKPLKRGKACLTCRFLKIKCDGEKPICGPCEKHPKDDPCEYQDGPGRSRTRMLEETIAKLEARIRELEDPQHSAPSMTLHDPYVKEQPFSPVLQLTVPPLPQPGESYSFSNSPTSPFSATSSLSSQSTPPFTPPSMTGSSISPRSATGLLLDAEDPPVSVTRELLPYFIPYAADFGVFLHVPRILTSATQPPFITHNTRPTVALIRTLHLWGAHFSGAKKWLDREHEFLLRALSETAIALSSVTHPQLALHTMQAEVLLAYYFFRRGRSLEARQHAYSAAQIALSCGLHKVRSLSTWRPTDLSLATNGLIFLTPSEDPVEEGEKINGFWAVVTLCKNLAVALEQPAQVCGLFEAAGLQIDTPWPLDMESYGDGKLPPMSSSTVYDFLSYKQADSAPSVTTSYTKACLLFHRATYLSGQYSPNMQHSQLESFNSSFKLIHVVLESFRATLQPVDNLNPNDPMTRTICVSHALFYGATIRLHSLFSFSDLASRQQCLGAAHAMLHLRSVVSAQDLGRLNPIMGTLWMTACQVFVDELTRLQSLQGSWDPSAGSPTDVRQNEADLLASLQTCLSALSYFARESEVMRQWLTLIQEIYPATRQKSLILVQDNTYDYGENYTVDGLGTSERRLSGEFYPEDSVSEAESWQSPSYHSGFSIPLAA